ncbi:Acyl carrier protein-like protein, partial [Metarhizium majus ARSEF 297]
MADLSSPGPFFAYATIRQQDAKTGTSLCDVYLTDSEDKIVAICTDICFKKLDRDFFALLTGSASALPPNPRVAKASPRRDCPKVRTPDSSSGLTAPPSVSSSASLSSSSDVADLSAELLDVVAVWSGIDVAELNKTTGTTFTEMGVDSQMNIAILADFQRATAVELPAAFFTNFPTPAEVRKELGSQHVEDVKESKQQPKQHHEHHPGERSGIRMHILRHQASSFSDSSLILSALKPEI